MIYLFFLSFLRFAAVIPYKFIVRNSAAILMPELKEIINKNESSKSFQDMSRYRELCKFKLQNPSSNAILYLDLIFFANVKDSILILNSYDEFCKEVESNKVVFRKMSYK